MRDALAEAHGNETARQRANAIRGDRLRNQLLGKHTDALPYARQADPTQQASITSAGEPNSRPPEALAYWIRVQEYAIREYTIRDASIGERP